MTMRIFTATWLLLAAHLISKTTMAQPQLEVSEDANYIAIDGWWTQCGSEFDANNGNACKGDLTSFEPTPIDVTGNTCYINPSRSASTEGAEHMVYWFSFQETSSGAFNAIYYSWYMPFADVDEFFPTECTAGGACFCGAFEQLRTGWNTTDSGACSGAGAIAMPETHGCAFGAFQPLESTFTETECAWKKSMFREYKETSSSAGTFTINACALAASYTSLAPTVSPAPSQAPSQAPSCALHQATTGIGLVVSALALGTALF